MLDSLKARLQGANPDERDISDRAKLEWEKFNGPAQNALSAFQSSVNSTVAAFNLMHEQARQVIAERMLKLDSLDKKDWIVNLDTMKFTRRPKATEETNGALGK